MLGAVVEGVPAGLALTEDDLAVDLARRQRGYGRGARQSIEQDRARILSGVRHGRTLGSPILLEVDNRDWANWTRVMQVAPLSEEEAAELATLADEGNKRAQPITRVRPGHADLAGALKYGFNDVRNALERSSARETTARVAAGGVARAFLRELGIEVWSFTAEVGGVAIDPARCTRSREEADASPLRCPDPEAETAMIARIDEARSNGDTVGGVFEVVVHGAPVGLGSYVHWDRRLDAALAGAVMSINIVKGVELGLGFEQTRRFGSAVHDVIEGRRDDGTWVHRTNNAGGLTGGVTNGEPIVVRGAVKPISTLARPLPTADLVTGEPVEKAHYERSDISVVPGRRRHRRGDGDAHARPVRAREDGRRLDARGARQPPPRPGTDGRPDRGARGRRRLGRARGRVRGGRAAWRARRPSPTPARPARAGTTERRWTSCSSGCPGRARAPSAAAWRRATARRSSTSTTRSSATTGRSIPELFASEGEAAFRALEREAVAALGPPDASPRLRRVISPGGGAIVDPRNRWALYRGRLPVWLDVRTEVLAQRLRRSPNVRPLIQGGDPMSRIRQLAAARERFYGAAARVNGVAEVGGVVEAVEALVAAGLPRGTTLLRASTKIGDVVIGEGIAAPAVAEALTTAGGAAGDPRLGARGMGGVRRGACRGRCASSGGRWRSCCSRRARTRSGCRSSRTRRASSRDGGSSDGSRWSRSAAARSATRRGSSPPPTSAASPGSRSRRRSSPRSTARSAARPAWTCRRARTSSARSITRRRSCSTWRRCGRSPSASCGPRWARSSRWRRSATRRCSRRWRPRARRSRAATRPRSSAARSPRSSNGPRGRRSRS